MAKEPIPPPTLRRPADLFITKAMLERDGLSGAKDSNRVYYIIGKVLNDQCPKCTGELDTGWECNTCGKDCKPIIDLIEQIKQQGATDGPSRRAMDGHNERVG